MRFRDNFGHSASSPALSAAARDAVAATLRQYGAELKDDEPGHGLFDLKKGDSFPILGFQVSATVADDGRDKVSFELPDSWLQDLGELVESCYECCDPVSSARSLVLSWISWTAPALKNKTDFASQLDTLLTQYGFLELRARQFASHVEKACSSWQSFYASRSSLWEGDDV